MGDISGAGKHDKTVFDLYSGTGTIAQLLAPVTLQVPYKACRLTAYVYDPLYIVVNDLGERLGMDPKHDKTVFDLYSGTGTIAQLLAPVTKKVIGVEIVGEAVEEYRQANRFSCEEHLLFSLLTAVQAAFLPK